MKILHVNTSVHSGGAAKACLRLHNALIQEGANSVILNLNDKSKNNFVVNYIDTFYKKSKHILNFGFEMLGIKLFVKPSVVPFSFGVLGLNITHNKYFMDADIIHLHWINQGMLSIATIKKICKSNKKIVWTFHDAWASTGGCHVKAGCVNYLTECGNCPVISVSLLNNVPKLLFNKKLELFARNNINVITPSNWLLQEIKKSAITLNTNVINIPNTLDVNVFTPLERICDSPSFKILIGYMKINASGHKGLNYAAEAIKLFMKNNSTLTIEISVFGCTTNDLNIINLPNCKALGFIKDELKMAQAYCNANVYIAPYLEDNFPNTVLESLSCGTPVVAFNAGGVPELIKHKHNGYLASPKNIGELAQGMQWILTQEKEKIKNNARNYVLYNYESTIIAKKHLDYYNSI